MINYWKTKYSVDEEFAAEKLLTQLAQTFGYDTADVEASKIVFRLVDNNPKFAFKTVLFVGTVCVLLKDIGATTPLMIDEKSYVYALNRIVSMLKDGKTFVIEKIRKSWTNWPSDDYEQFDKDKVACFLFDCALQGFG